MKQGWFNENYWIFFNKEELLRWTDAYGIDLYLPGYGMYGLRGWDDFILLDGNGFYTIPTVPMFAEKLLRIDLNVTMELEQDSRYVDRIKWYTTPICIGGSPTDDANITFVDMEQHSKLVRWWNEQLFTKTKVK